MITLTCLSVKENGTKLKIPGAEEIVVPKFRISDIFTRNRRKGQSPVTDVSTATATAGCMSEVFGYLFVNFR